MDKDLKNKTMTQLQEIIIASGGKAYQAQAAFSFIHQKFAESIDEFTTIKKDIRASLIEQGYFVSNLKTAEKLIDPDGTEKYLFELSDGNVIETVFLRESDRNTVCISCQVGCQLGCRFCATGFIKFERNLTAGEIVDQVLKISANAGKINNIVYMGMGEPMYNYDSILTAIRILTDQKGLNIGIRKQTISTCGIPEGIRRLAGENITPRLAVSLHAASGTIRKKLMPIASTHSMTELLSAMKYYQQETSRRITIEYCMIKGINDSLSDAKDLAAFLRPLQANVNLIEYNPHPGCDFQGSQSKAIKIFKDSLMQSGIETIVRYRRGRSIKAACGQLGADRIKK